MYARVVRFTGVSPERIEEVAAQIKSSDGPPPGVPGKGIKMLYDAAESTSVAIVFFETEEDMRTGGEALDAMDTSDTPGTRVSVDNCEVMAEMDVS
jgi:hypothetical protein